MGLAASQGRLLLLTGRKSDLEFQAQSISQSRLVLSREQEGISTKYAQAMAATCLKMTINKDNKSEEVDFTMAEFAKAYYKDGKPSGSYRFTDKDGNVLTIKEDGTVTGGNLTNEQRAALKSDKGGSESILKFLIETGVLKLQKQDEKDKTKWEDASISGETKFREVHDSTNDAKEESQYNADMQRVKVKDQQLEMDLKGIETQHKAIETEYESVQKVIQKNIEVSFKIFS